MRTRMSVPLRSVLTLIAGVLLAGATQPALALRIDPHAGCARMCGGEFWQSANSASVETRLSDNPAARGYLRRMLWLAVETGNAGAVAALLRAGAPPNSRQDKTGGKFVLQEAAARGNGRIVSLLLKAGAFPNLAGPNGGTPLHVAAGFGRVDAVAALLAAGANPRVSDDRGTTVGWFARTRIEDMSASLWRWKFELSDMYPPLPPPCRKCRNEVLALLKAPPPVPGCGKLCTPEFWKTADEDRVRSALGRAPAGARLSEPGGGPLHRAIAARAGTALVNRLLDHGLDPNGRDMNDDTPLHVAARTPGSVAAIALLLEHGATIGALNTRDWTPLHAAAERVSTLDNMRALLDAGADPHVRAGGTLAATPRDHAVSQPEGSEGARLILRYGSAEGNSPNALQKLPFSAALSGHPDTIALLADRGVDVRRPSFIGYTPLHYAASSGNVATMRLLLQMGADPNYSKYDYPAIVSGQGERPLHLAVPHPAAVALLLEFGADPNGRVPTTGERPLQMAAKKCAGETLGLLLKHGASPNAGVPTPLYNAVRRVADSRDGREVKENWLALCEEEEKSNEADCKELAINQYREEHEPRRECERNIVTLVEFGARSDIGRGDTPLDMAKRHKLDKSIVNVLKRARYPGVLRPEK